MNIKEKLKALKEQKAERQDELDAMIDAESYDKTLADELKEEIKGISNRIKYYSERYDEEQEAARIAKKFDDTEKPETKADGVHRFANVNTETKAYEKDEIEIYQKFSIHNAMTKLANGQVLDGAEAEGNDIGIKEHGDRKMIGQLAIPEALIKFPGKDVWKEKQVTVGTEGANIVDTTFGPKIPFLSIDPAVIRAGARTFTNQTSDLHFPKDSNELTVAWEGETDATDETTATYTNIKLSPQRLACFTRWSLQAGIQSSFDLEADLRARLSRSASIEWDRAVLIGTGTGEPLGIINTPGVNTVTLATANKVDWATAIAFQTGLAGANVTDGPLAYLSTAGVGGHLMTYPKDAGSGRFVMEDGRIGMYPFFMDNNLPSTGGVGTNEHTMVFGKWSDLYLAQFGGTSILYNPYADDREGMARLTMNMYLDNELAHEESFNYAPDIIP